MNKKNIYLLIWKLNNIQYNLINLKKLERDNISEKIKSEIWTETDKINALGKKYGKLNA